MKHQAFAVPAFAGHESSEVLDFAQFRLAESSGNFSYCNGRNFKLDHAFLVCFDLLRSVQQFCRHDRYACWGIPNYFAFNNACNKLELVGREQIPPPAKEKSIRPKRRAMQPGLLSDSSGYLPSVTISS